MMLSMELVHPVILRTNHNGRMRKRVVVLLSYMAAKQTRKILCHRFSRYRKCNFRNTVPLDVCSRRTPVAQLLLACAERIHVRCADGGVK
jgi:hypothetical protein